MGIGGHDRLSCPPLVARTVSRSIRLGLSGGMGDGSFHFLDTRAPRESQIGIMGQRSPHEKRNAPNLFIFSESGRVIDLRGVPLSVSALGAGDSLVSRSAYTLARGPVLGPGSGFPDNWLKILSDVFDRAVRKGRDYGSVRRITITS